MIIYEDFTSYELMCVSTLAIQD